MKSLAVGILAILVVTGSATVGYIGIKQGREDAVEANAIHNINQVALQALAMTEVYSEGNPSASHEYIRFSIDNWRENLSPWDGIIGGASTFIESYDEQIAPLASQAISGQKTEDKQ